MFAPVLIVPNKLHGLSQERSFLVYRDELRWPVYPVTPPEADVKDAGKQPAIREWWNYNPYDCNLGRFFRRKRPYNIGVCPIRPLIFVDLDSKPDKGASVREWLSAHPELNKFPRHVSRGGVHLVMVCEDLPTFLDKHGSPYHEKLTSWLSEKVSAELFHSSHSNIVLPCSRHPVRDNETDAYFVYAWTHFGEIPHVTWQWLQDTFGFKAPEYPPKERSKKKSAWHLQFKGDLASLNLIKLLEELGHTSILANADEGKYSILCPWNKEHTDPDPTVSGTATVIWQIADDQHWPSFDCKHSHCTKRKLEQLLQWAESKAGGIVDRHCARQRVWDQSAREHLGKNRLPRVLHAEGRVESVVYKEIGEIIAPHHIWFNRAAWVVHIEKVASGFEYSPDPKKRYKISAFNCGLRELSPLLAKGSLEYYMEPGVLREDDNGEQVFVPKSLSTDFCAGMVQSTQLRTCLDYITRILTVPLPFRSGAELIYPRKGFDPRFGTYLVPNSPDIDYAMPITEAWELVAQMLSGFCFTSEQSRTHAVARLLTPFARALLGWTTRVPLWPFIGSRPRCGKDYLSGCVLILYEGFAFEDQPITGRDSSVETGKRILAAARAGRRFMHFSNCEQNLKDTALTQAITDPRISGRALGSNDPKADITVPNEMEFSVSFNLGLRIAEDLLPRSRPISLAFYEEDPNSRIFPDPHLHETLAKNRAKFLSAFAAIFKVWEKADFPNGPTPFTSFVDWAEIIGGVMFANREHMYAAFEPIPIEGLEQSKFARPSEGWGDPCLPWNDEFSESVTDRRTAAMTALFIVCSKEFGDTEVKNKDIIACVARYQTPSHSKEDESAKEDQSDNGKSEDPEPKYKYGGPENRETEAQSISDAHLEALNYFGRLDHGEGAPGNKISLMRALRAFKGRILAGIRLRIKPNMNRQKRDLYQFITEPRDNTTAENIQSNALQSPTEGAAKAENVSSPGPMAQIGPIFPFTAYTHEKILRQTHIKYRCPARKKEFYSNIASNNKANLGHWATSISSVAFDIETYAEPKIGRKGRRITATGDALDPFKGEIRLATLVDSDGNISQFDLRETPTLPPEVLDVLGREELVIHNAAFELRFLATKLGLWPQRVFCTLTASRLLAPIKTVPHALGPVLERCLDVKLAKEHGSSDWGALVLTECQKLYARDDVRYLHRLRLVLASALAEEDLTHIFDLEMALLPIITRMELHGFAIDVDKLKAALPEQKARAEAKMQALREAFGKPELNPNSPDQVLEIFKAAGIELVKSNVDGSREETTKEELLCTIDDPRAALVLEYRKAEKLATTLDSLLDVVREDGRIYARFNPLGAMTGRFSSKNPNLQQVPKKGARHVRTIFVAGTPERRLIVADYSQIELRVAALVAGETVMIDAFRDHVDLHTKIAAVSLRVSPEQVTPEQRDIGKTINFGFLYGRSAEGYRRGVRKDCGLILTSEQALGYRNSFFATYPAVAAWHEECRRKARDPANNRARTIFGRLLCAQIDDAWARFNLWTNYVVQGACADLLKMAMVKVASILPSYCHLVATVHDELIYDVPLSLSEQYCGMIRMAMEETFVEMFGSEVPIVAEAKVCKNWGEK
jgi:DNA polymerase I-like protein with 3'-5' exonuclease and polymerase domains